MSGEPKTHTLTFQEAVELLGREYRAALVFLPDSPDQRGDAWSTLSIDEEGYAVEDFAPTWEETMSAALGVRVVARDEAAELRAAVREFFKAEDAVAALHEPNGTYTDFHAAADIANAARETLRRLAGGENEK